MHLALIPLFQFQFRLLLPECARKCIELCDQNVLLDRDILGAFLRDACLEIPRKT